MIQVHCAEIWGGIQPANDDVCTSGVTATLYSSAAGAPGGGDIHYFSVCSYDILTRVVIADVRGHGAAAAELSQWLYLSLLEHMNSEDGAAILDELNQKVCEIGHSALTTAAVLSYNRDDGQLYYANAGHPPPYLFRQQQGWSRLLVDDAPGAANLPLGILKKTRYDQQPHALGAGDRLFLYTDGLTECPGADGNVFDEARLEDSLSLSALESLHSVKTNLLKELCQFSSGALLHDDCTFLCFEPRPKDSIDSSS
ncbi:MAG: serine/threonine-protein phosphatase [Acidobacteria bacterium]|nr:serine/threonine-protein phosphatase [Acidobacteriota bacterium]